MAHDKPMTKNEMDAATEGWPDLPIYVNGYEVKHVALHPTTVPGKPVTPPTEIHFLAPDAPVKPA